MQMFLLKISEICQTIAHNSPPLTRQQLRMLLVHRSKRKFLGRKGGKKSLLSGRTVFTSIWRVFCVDLLGWPHVPICIPSAGSHPFDAYFPSHVLLWVNKSHSKDKTSQQDGSCMQTQWAGRPLSLFFLSMGRQRSSRNMQEQSPANLLHSGQRDSNLDKQPPVERPVYCGQRVGWAFRPGSNSGENKASLFTRGFTEHDTFGRLG